MKEIEIPLYEEDTLEGVIRKAVRAGRIEEVTFDDRSYGSQLGGTGRLNIASLDAALDFAGQAMEAAARRYYPDQAAAIDGGSRNGDHMIPELSATIEIAENSNEGTNELFDVSDLYVGKMITGRDNNGNGAVDLVISPSAAAIIHAHWLDTNPRSADRQTVRGGFAEMGRRNYAQRPQFWIYQWRGNRRRYA